jgi:hypothetical protein
MDTASGPRWRTSSYSGADGGECVEVGQDQDLIAIRDTKNRTGPVLPFAPQTWRRFARQVSVRNTPGPVTRGGGA